MSQTEAQYNVGEHCC